MTKFEAVVVTAVGVGVAGNQIVHAAIVADTGLPQWVTIIGVLGMPILGLMGILGTFLHLGAKVDASKKEVTDKVEVLEVKFDGKMDLLLALAKEAAFAAGLAKGLADADAAAKAAIEKSLIEEGYRAQGAAALLIAQQTPPPVFPPTDVKPS